MDQTQLDQMIQSEIDSAVETLLKGREVATVSAESARSVFGRAVQRIRAYERDSVLLDIMTVDDVAQHYGVGARRIVAKARWLRAHGQSVGWQVPGRRTWLFWRSEIGNLAPMLVGRPRVTPHSD